MIKEVADVTFYEIGADGKPTTPVLFLDTLKVSSIEQTAETTEARGGKGNPALISWDFGKEITINIEDALFSPKSMNIMFGKAGANISKTADRVSRIVPFTLTSTGGLPETVTAQIPDSNGGFRTATLDCNGAPVVSGAEAWPSGYMLMKGVFLEDGTELKTSTNSPITDTTTWASYTPPSGNVNAGKKAYLKYEASATKATVTITKDSFPGTWTTLMSAVWGFINNKLDLVNCWNPKFL